MCMTITSRMLYLECGLKLTSSKLLFTTMRQLGQTQESKGLSHNVRPAHGKCHHVPHMHDNLSIVNRNINMVRKPGSCDEYVIVLIYGF